MSTYLIGDVHGCWRSLRALVEHVGFSATRDRLWLVGDLVNRGPGSVDVLRYVADFGDAATSVLGNHDLHLLGRALGVRGARRRDTIEQVLEAPDRDDLIRWLAARPLLLVDDASGLMLVHSGLLPQWQAHEAVDLASEVEQVLHGHNAACLLADDRPATSDVWRQDLHGEQRWRVVLDALTRIRVCTAQGRMIHEFKKPPSQVPQGVFPWYAAPGRRSSQTTIAFGHWAAHGHAVGDNWIALDSGCVWGGQLTCVRTEDRAVFAVDCAPADRVG